MSGSHLLAAETVKPRAGVTDAVALAIIMVQARGRWRMEKRLRRVIGSV